MIEERCENKCCSISTIPLRVCKAITIHKGQGITVGKDEYWKNVIIYFAEDKARTNPGIELVALSRASDPNCLYIGNQKSRLTKEKLRNIGQGEAYEKRKHFEQYLSSISLPSQKSFIDEITNLDDSNENNCKTFEGGCKFLCKWYRRMCPTKNINK